MALSWNIIEKDTPPVLGLPSQFADVAETFKGISDRTEPLSDELWDISRGRSEGFAGAAADAVGSQVGSLLEPLTDVPKVADGIQGVFDRHGLDLEVLIQKADQALARARVRWNRKREAESDISGYKSQISNLSSQISQLHCCCPDQCSCGVPSRRRYLTNRRDVAESNLRGAERERNTAEDLLDKSRSEWDRLHDEEEDLNERSAKQLEDLPLWSLKDTGNWFTEAAENLWEYIQESWDTFVDELLEVLHETLSKLLDWMDIAGLILEWIPLVNVAFKAVELLLIGMKTAAGLCLVLSGQMSFGEFLTEAAMDAMGVLVPGGRLIGKGLKRVSKSGAPGRLLNSVGKKIDDAGEAIQRVSQKVTRGAADFIVRRSPSIRRFNDLLYKPHWKLYRKKWWPSYHPKPNRRQKLWGVQLQNLDEHSWITRNLRKYDFVRKDSLVPYGKSYEAWSQIRTSDWLENDAWRTYELVDSLAKD